MIFIFLLKSCSSKDNDIEKIKILKEPYYIKGLILYDFEKKKHLISEKKADFYILNFWASWCLPCVKEMKSLNVLQKRNKKLRVLTVSTDNDVEDAIDYFKKNNYKYLEKYYDIQKSVLSKFSVRGLPTTFVINENLLVIAKVEGIIDWKSKKFIQWLKEIKNIKNLIFLGHLI